MSAITVDKVKNKKSLKKICSNAQFPSGEQFMVHNPHSTNVFWDNIFLR